MRVCLILFYGNQSKAITEKLGVYSELPLEWIQLSENDNVSAIVTAWQYCPVSVSYSENSKEAKEIAMNLLTVSWVE